MTKTKRPSPKLLSASLLLALLATSSLLGAITPTEWSQRQTLAVDAPGLVKIPVPAATFDANQQGLADLRLIDASGREIPYLLDTPPPSKPDSLTPAKTVSTRQDQQSLTSLIIETGTNDPLESIELQTAAPYFLKAAHLEISDNGQSWQSLGPAVPIFRQFGAEQLQLPLGRQSAPYIRITLDESRSRNVAFNGARIKRAPAEPIQQALVPLGAKITRRDEFAGESVLTVELDGRHTPLASLTFQTDEPLFTRHVSVSVREVNQGVSAERTIASGTIYRLAINGIPTREQLSLPIEFTPLTRELLVHIHNHDSPLISIAAVQASQRPTNLLFMAPAAGSYTLLSGNPQVSAPRYDLAAFAADLRTATANPLTPGPIEATPNYSPRKTFNTAPLQDIPLTGASLDTQDWTQSQPIRITRPGVQELELNLAALAQSQSSFADLRLLHQGNQIPYVLERPALSRSLSLSPELDPDPKRPTLSRWRLDLPQAGLPLQKIVLYSSTPLFQRQFRIYETRTNQNGATRDHLCAVGSWSRTPEPGNSPSRVFELTEQPQTSTLWIESDNGDNPAIQLGTVQTTYPVVRLIFKTAQTDGFTLAYGNAQAKAPRYDLSLVAVKLFTASRAAAQLPPDDLSAASPTTKNVFGSLNNAYLFWAALAFAVIVLLVVVAKLLPKPPTS